MSEVWTRLHPCRFGILFALLTLLFGFGLGAAFGANEDGLKGYLNDEAQAVLADKYNGDEAKAKKVTSKSWTYFKRAHLHANGLGTSALVLILLLACLAASDRTKAFVALASGVGGLGYAVFWLWSGARAPGLGSTGAAKESLEWLAIPSSALCIAGLLAVLVLLVRTMVRAGRSA